MPGKHVHFAEPHEADYSDSPTFYSSQPPSIPTPSSAGYPWNFPWPNPVSLPSPTFYSPSPVGYPWNSPYSNAKPSPSIYRNCIGLHRFLQSSSLDWDMRKDPSTITLTGISYPIFSQTFAESATIPPVADITINTLLFPWTINVHATNNSYITLADVFNSIYKSLRCNITQSEFNSLSAARQYTVSTAYHKRYKRQPSVEMAEKEKQGGMKRVDYLVRNTNFLGISNSGSPGKFYLNTTVGIENHPVQVLKAPTLQISKGLQATSIPSSTSEAAPHTNDGHTQLSSTPSERPVHTFLHAHAPPASFNIEHPHQQNRPALPESLAPPFEQGGPHLTSIDDRHEELKVTDPNANNQTRTKDPPPDQVETTCSESVHMFEQARDISISGGEFYAAASISIDASHNEGASAHFTNTYHLWQSNHTAKMPENNGEQVNCHLERTESGVDLSLDTRNGMGEGGTADEGGGMASGQVENEYPSPVLDSPTDLFEYELERHHEQDLQNAIITSTATSFLDSTIADDVVYDILSNYPRRPVRNPRLFERILQALVISFSPLSSMMIAALFDLNDAQHVKQILLPAYPLVFIPKSEEKKDENADLTAVRFICPSIVEFFLDRTRGGKYYVDVPSAHRALLDGCTSVMEKVYLEGRRFDELGRGWRDAYEYACQNWERHRRAGLRSKL